VTISAGHLLQISDRLIDLWNSIPSEFTRRPRSLLEVGHWKTTELRQFQSKKVNVQGHGGISSQHLVGGSIQYLNSDVVEFNCNQRYFYK